MPGCLRESTSERLDCPAILCNVFPLLASAKRDTSTHGSLAKMVTSCYDFPPPSPLILVSQKLSTFSLKISSLQRFLVQILAAFAMNQHPSYVKLDYARREIRLLTILDDDDDYLVRCMTRTTSPDDCQNFNALSYSWGDPEVTALIMVNYHVMSVTLNLEKALRQLRRSAQLGEIWIDAICINQADNSKKKITRCL